MNCINPDHPIDCLCKTPPHVPPAGTTKPTNPKDAIGSSKVPSFSVVPQRVMTELGLAMLEGACKYGRHNYRTAGVRASVYLDACVSRHLAAFWEGQDIDPGSGLSHITKAIAGLVVLRDSMLRGNWVDDRPPRSENPDWIDALNTQAAAIVAKYRNPPPPHTQIPGVLEQRCKSCGSIPPAGCSDCR